MCKNIVYIGFHSFAGGSWNISLADGRFLFVGCVGFMVVWVLCVGYLTLNPFL